MKTEHENPMETQNPLIPPQHTQLCSISLSLSLSLLCLNHVYCQKLYQSCKLKDGKALTEILGLKQKQSHSLRLIMCCLVKQVNTGSLSFPQTITPVVEAAETEVGYKYLHLYVFWPLTEERKEVFDFRVPIASLLSSIHNNQFF